MVIKIVTDSTADLSPELISRYSLEVVPLYVNFGDEVYRDGIDLNPENFLAKVQSTPVFPRTSQPTPADFLQVFRRLLAEGNEVIFIGISSDLSGTIQSALLAKNELATDSIAVVDSRNLAMGIGLMVLRAAELAGEGMRFKELVSILETMPPRLRTTFVVDTLDFLYKGGRLSKAQAVIGNVLNIHPRIEVNEGKLGLVEKIRGRREKSNARLVEWIMQAAEKVDRRRIVVEHCHAEEDAAYIREKLAEANLAEEILTAKAGTVISSHCGPGTVGVLYMEKEV